MTHTGLHALADLLQPGDVVFIRIDILPFRKIAHHTGSWTNHVGIVETVENGSPVIAESTFPFSTRTPLAKFIGRSQNGRVAVSRLRAPLSPAQCKTLKSAVEKRMGVFYDSGFNLASRRQFCSRFVREVIQEATGITLGNVETLQSLFQSNPLAEVWFWRLWYFGIIPWARETVTPASLLESPHLVKIFDGYVESAGVIDNNA